MRLGGTRDDRYITWEDTEDIRYQGGASFRSIVERQDDPDSALWEFIALGNKTAEQIASFANARGVLGLCGDKMPYTHNAPADEWLAENETQRMQAVVKGFRCEPLARERVAAWRLWAQRFRAALSIAAELAYDRPGRDADWEILYSMVRNEPSNSYPTIADYRGNDLADERGRLYEVFDYWTCIAQVHPVPEWAGLQGMHLTLAGHGLFGMLVAQLVALITSHQGVVRCSRERCRKLVATRRKPRRDQPVYCTDGCRLEVRRTTAREAQRLRRATLRGVKSERGATATSAVGHTGVTDAG